MLKRIYFAPKTDKDVTQLLLEYRQLHKFVCEMAVEFCKENSVISEFISCLFKQFVLKNKESAKSLFNFLSFLVCLLTSEAIVESWGSSIDHLLKIKPNTKEGLDLENTGTVDKLALILKGDCVSHFLHIGRNLKANLIAVDRNLSSNEALPCFLNSL